MKKAKLSKMISMALTLVMSASLLAGCGTKTTETTTVKKTVDATKPGWKQDIKPVTLDWYINYNWFPAKWGEDLTSKYVTKKTGVNFNIQVPAGDANQKLNTMIASGTLPDIITMAWTEDGYKKLIEGGLVEPLDELAKEYDPYFTKIADPAKASWYTQADGHYYAYPNSSSSPADFEKYKEVKPSNQTFLVKKDMYEAIGKPDMKTPEGFLNALKMAKEKFPSVNGKAMIPFGLHEFTNAGNYSLEGYLQNFLSIPFEKDGKLYDKVSDPDYIKWLKTFRTMNEDGLLAKDVFIDKRPQMEEKIAQGRYFSMLYQRSDMATQEQILYNKDPKSVYIAVDGPSNTALDAPKLSGNGVSGWTVTMISKSCKDKARAIKMLGYLISEEGQKDLYLGEKGVSYDSIDGKDQFKPEVLKMLNTDRGAFDKKYGSSFTFWQLMNTDMSLKWAPASVEPAKQMEDWTKGKTFNYSQYDNTDPLNDSNEGVSATKIADLWGTALPKLLMSKSEADFDSILVQFKAKRSKSGFDALVKFKEKKIAENKKKLNIK